MATLLLSILIFFLGASVGSFLSVVVYRIEKKKSGIIFGHSFCPSCKKRLRSRDLVPIVSYLMLRGKCGQCGTKISPLYLFIEIVTGLMFLSLYFRYPFLESASLESATLSTPLLISFTFFAIYTSFFAAIFFYDLKTKKIPDVFLFPLILFTAVGTLTLGTPSFVSVLLALAIAAVFFGGQIVVSKGKWLGEGDFYLALALAIIFGWELFVTNIVISYFLGAIIGIALLATKKATKKTAIPFGPFLVLGAIITIFFGQDLMNLYLSNLTI